MFLLLTIVDSFLIANTVLYATTCILHRVELHLYSVGKRLENTDIQIAIDYEMNLNISYISIF